MPNDSVIRCTTAQILGVHELAPTLAEYVAYLRNRRYAARTVDIYRQWVADFIRWSTRGRHREDINEALVYRFVGCPTYCRRRVEGRARRQPYEERAALVQWLAMLRADGLDVAPILRVPCPTQVLRKPQWGPGHREACARPTRFTCPPLVCMQRTGDAASAQRVTQVRGPPLPSEHDEPPSRWPTLLARRGR